MTKRAAVAFLLALLPLGIGPGAGQPRPVDPRIQAIPYDPDQITPLKGTLGYQFMIEFDAAEKIQTVSIGDALSWQVTPNGQANVLFLKPMARSVTNMTVLTNLRRYAFELRAAAAKPDEPILYIARMVYPRPAPAAPPPPKTDPGPQVANSAYVMKGAQVERPVRIFDDGHMTYFEWPPETALPAIFAVSEDGSESLVNYAVRGPYIVVDQLAKGFVLRNGKDVVKIANNGPFNRAMQ
jgi:type IV secretion system protein VirB9